MNKEFRNYLLNSLDKGVRIDSRGMLDYRPVVVEYGVSSTAEGSARVKIGDTEVIAGVKMEIATPFPDRPDDGAIMMNAEFLAMSSPEFESGPPGMDAIELARVVDRGIRECKAVDLKKLIIKKGEKCWMIVVDICTINDAGNLLDASALASIAALQDARFPKYENEEIDYKTRTDKKIELGKIPIAVTVVKLGNNFLIDPNIDEQKAIDARLTVTVTEDNTICALQKGGDNPMFVEDISKMVDIALDKSKELRGYLTA